MRIAIFTTAYLPFVGGAEVALYEITKRLPDIHFDIYTAKLKAYLPKVEKNKNVTIFRLGRGIFLDKLILAFRGHLVADQKHQTDSYDFVWGVMASFGGLAARNFKRKNPNVPFLLTLQEGDDLVRIEQKGKLMFGAFPDIFKQANYIQVISRFLGGWARQKNPKGEILIIPNGVDLSIFRPRREEGVVKEPIIITTSRLVPKNGIADLIKTLTYLPTDTQLWILGDGPLKSSLEILAKKLKIADRVQFFGTVSYKKLPDYLNQARVFVRPSLSEGLGNSFLEAMAVGVPVVGTPVGGIPDFLKEGKTGFFCEVNNSENIATKIKYILNQDHHQEISLIIRQARALVEQKYDWDIIALQFRNLFNSIK